MIDVVCAVPIRENGEVFVGRRLNTKSQPGKWEFIGGKVNEGESLESAIERELFEELGVQSKIIDYVGNNVHNYGCKTIKLHAFIVELLEAPQFSLDHDLLMWAPFKKLIELDLADADRPIINKIRQYVTLS